MVVMIAGAGIGGLSLALALSRRGIGSLIMDQAASIEAVGAGIQLSPNAVRVLDGWSLEAGLLAVAVEHERAEVRDAANGRLLLSTRLGVFARARWGAPYLTVTRSALQNLLLTAVESTGRVELRLGSRVASVDAEAGAVTLEAGERLVGDAVVGCDGLRSTVQAALFGAVQPRFTGQTAWRGLARVEDTEAVVRVFTGVKRHFVRYPVAPGVVNMVAVKEAAAGEVEAWGAAGARAELAAAFSDWPETVRETIAAVERPWRQALYARRPLARWSKGRATLLGDAAHPMLPFLAQGAAMAIEDAEALARRLASGGDIPATLFDYEAERRGRTAKVQAWAERNATLFHLPSPAARAVFALGALTAQPAEARLDWLYGHGG